VSSLVIVISFFLLIYVLFVEQVITGALHNCLSVREDGCDCEAAGALDVHEEGAWAWDEGLELVLARLGGGGWVEEIDCEDHLDSLFVRFCRGLCVGLRW